MSEDVSPTISVLIVTYNSEREVTRSLREVIDHPLVTEVVVVDNASTDETVKALEPMQGRISLVRSDKNLGFAGGVNVAARQATGRYLLLLNPDCFVSPTTLKGLFDAAMADSSIGVLGPVVRDGQSRGTIPAGWQPTTARALAHATGAARALSGVGLRGLYVYPKAIRGVTSLDVEWVSGACMLIERELWDELRGMNEEWFMYSEDLDLCRRAAMAGRRVVLLTNIFVDHVGGASHDVQAESVSTRWIVSLLSYHRDYLAQNQIDHLLFRYFLSLGFLARWAALRLVGRLSGRPDVATRASGFWRYFVACRTRTGANARRRGR